MMVLLVMPPFARLFGRGSNAPTNASNTKLALSITAAGFTCLPPSVCPMHTCWRWCTFSTQILAAPSGSSLAISLIARATIAQRSSSAWLLVHCTTRLKTSPVAGAADATSPKLPRLTSLPRTRLSKLTFEKSTGHCSSKSRHRPAVDAFHDSQLCVLLASDFPLPAPCQSDVCLELKVSSGAGVRRPLSATRAMHSFTTGAKDWGVAINDPNGMSRRLSRAVLSSKVLCRILKAFFCACKIANRLNTSEARCATPRISWVLAIA
mmetsp:Transcript_38125/g.89358  ORF Transcript_38125/g.89358 Transcript_38125/m.89358 type:complete len:265 (-) Transcript_38125:2888-3682(-)